MTNSHDQSSESIAAASEVDVLSDMLRSVRLTGSMLFLVEASTPWVSWAPQTKSFQRLVLPAAQHLISFHIVTRGGCWAGLAGAPPERFEAGDVLVIPHGDAYYLADPPAAERTYDFEEALTFFRRHGGRQVAIDGLRRWQRTGNDAIHLRFSRLRFAAIQSRAVGAAAPASRPPCDARREMACLI